MQTAVQANSRTIFAFSRDGAFPDRGLLGKINKHTNTPIWSVWIIIFIGFVMGLLSFASLVAVNAIFAMVSRAMLAGTELILSVLLPWTSRISFLSCVDVSLT